MTAFRPNGLVTLLTDFGHADVYAGAMKGVILSIAPQARIVDLTHGVPPQQVEVGALQLAAAAPYFPAGTVHLAVVDPGVGTARRPLALFENGHAFVGPDNGLLTLAAGPKAKGRLLENRRLFLGSVSPTFHGRDLFAPVAAYLSLGVDPASLGRAVRPKAELKLPRPYRENGELIGEVIAVDGFGNVVTNVSEAVLRKAFRNLAKFSLEARGVRIHGLSRTYGDRPPGALVALVGSAGYLEIAEVNGSAAKRLGLAPAEKIVLSI